jgi:erythromycin esterase-like protein
VAGVFTWREVAAAAKENNRLAQPIEPVAAILNTFRAYQIVALGEGNHNNEQAHRFRLSLIRNPRFTATVNDIVVEFGNARYQDVMDRFVRGEDVPDHVLHQVWQNTTAHSAVWDVAIYEEFFRALRAVNASVAKERQLRVLLGDPPVCWNAPLSIETQREDFQTREVVAARMISREVVAKHRRALIIYATSAGALPIRGIAL